MSVSNAIPILVLIARPAAGKSEVIAYLKNLEPDERLERFSLGELHRIDDFPMLWTWFEEDRILADMGKPRLHTDEDGYFKHHYLWDLLIERISLEYAKLKRDLEDDAGSASTVVIEFSRGKEHGGFRRAFEHLSDEILEKCAVLYIDVSYEESVRKNQSRFNPDRPDSILEHGLPADKMKTLYKDSDWEELLAEWGVSTAARGDDESCGVFRVKGHDIPYSVLPNEDDVTTAGGKVLGDRLEQAVERLLREARKLI